MHKLSISLSAALMSLAISTVALAASPSAAPSASEVAIQQGLDFARKGEFGKAIEIWKPLAVGGNATAQFDLAFMYAGGRGVAKDEAQAVVWYRKAADQGYPDAQHSLNIMLNRQ